MKFKAIFFIAILALITLCAVSASDDFNGNLTVENQNSNVNGAGSTVLTNNDGELVGEDESSNKKTTPSITKVKFSSYVSKYKKNKSLKIKLTDKKTKKPLKNVKFKLKIKLSKGKYKTCTLKTDKKGIAKYNLKKLKVGVHKVMISSKTLNFDTDFSFVNIWKTKKTTTLRMNTQKKVNGEAMFAFYETHNNRQFPKGVFVTGDMGGDNNGFVLLKVKFFFKNKKTGKIITKTTTSADMGVKLIRGYTPIKAKVCYGTLR